MSISIDDIISIIPKLDHDDRVRLQKALNHIDDLEKVCDTIESLQEIQRHCPYCHSSNVHRHGSFSGLQRYKCMNCSKTFNSLTGTPLARLRKKELWLSYLDCMRESMTLRKCASELGINVKTAFRWRHRITGLLCKDSREQLNGIVEADETYFEKSDKGSRELKRPPHLRGKSTRKRGLSKNKVCVLVACDRSKQSKEFITGLGPVKTKWLNRIFTEKIAPDSILVTDGLISYTHFCTGNHIDHEIVKNEAGKRRRESFHIQNVNSYHSRLKSWITYGFHGVATKYLNHYLWWRHVLEMKQIPDAMSFFEKLMEQIPQLKGI